jgi:histidinol-phosphate aminotransferase
MSMARRRFLQRIGAGAVMSSAVPALARAAQALQVPMPDVARLETAVQGQPVRLDRTFSVYGPSPKALEAIRTIGPEAASRYSDAETDALRRQIAATHAVTADRVVVGCGSTEILRMAVDAFAPAGKTLVEAAPTCGLIADFALLSGAHVDAIRLAPDHSHNLDAMLARCDSRTGLVYICNPNSPTGTLTGRKEIDAFIRKLPGTARVLIDEAYGHYVGESSRYESFLDRPLADPRVIVVRTFSKIYGLAGLRVGFAIASPETAAELAAHGLPDRISVAAARAAAAALGDIEYTLACVRRNADDRQAFLNQANARTMRSSIDSHANFVMLNAQHPAADVWEHLRQQGVIVARPVPFFDQHLRVSLGAPLEMRAFWHAWDQVVQHKM